MPRRDPLRLDPDFFRKYVGSIIEVHMVDGKVIRGRLVGFDMEYFNILLEEVETNQGRKVPAALISGSSISHVLFVGPPKLRIPRSRRRMNLEMKVKEIIKDNPNLDAETIAKLCNTKVDKVERILVKLKQKSKSGEREQGKSS